MAQQDVGTCLICKHPLVSKLNIFKTRTNFSKTLVSSKLAKLVQTTFRQDAMSHAQDICSSCSALINQVDECEIKLMALENEVKLKYKMPFPIEVHSRRSEQQPPPPQAPSDDPLSLGGAGTGDVVRGMGTAVQEVNGAKGEPHDAAPSDNQFNFISIDSGSLDNPTIVLEAGQVDADGNVVVYREPYGDQTLAYDPSMSYLAQLEASDLHQDDGSGDGEHVSGDAIRLDGPGDGESPGGRDDPPRDCGEEEGDSMGIVIQSAGGATRKRRVGRTRRRSSQEAADGDGMVLTCDLCDEVFNSADSLRTHKVCHASDKSFPCRFCQRVFSTNMALHYHWNEIHPLKLQPCPYCDKRFINKSNLNQHINTHQEPRFNCQIPQCNRQFHTRGDLRKHMVFKHSTEKNFSCPDCNLSFKVNWLLTRHRVRVHSQA